MTTPTPETWREKKCVPCEGGVPIIPAEQAKVYLGELPEWKLADSGNSIERKVLCKHFVDAVRLIGLIADLAEQEQHHPDLHLTGYRKLRIVLTTHAIGGLSENDFIVAAKIDTIMD